MSNNYDKVVGMLFHIHTGSKFHFEILSKILNITCDQEIQLLKFILRKQLNNYAKMYIQACPSKDTSEKI